VTTSTAWTVPQPLPEAVDLGPGFDAEALRRGLEALVERSDVMALVVFGKEARIQPEGQIQRWQELRGALGEVGRPVDLLVCVLGRAARGGRELYVAHVAHGGWEAAGRGAPGWMWRLISPALAWRWSKDGYGCMP
jgi:hypothetical protein